MAAKLKVSVVTPSRQVMRGEVDMVVAPAVSGEVGILAEHRSLLADLQEGPLTLRTDGRDDRYAISGGFLEVHLNNLTVLAETCERADEIDVERAKAALRDAEKKLSKAEAGDATYVEEQARVRRAQVRLHVAGQPK